MITGASRGLGKYLACFFYKNGYDLVLISSDLETLSASLGDISKRETQSILPISADLSDPLFFNDMLLKVESKVSKVDVIINNAAIHGEIGPLNSTTDEGWAEVMQVNFLAPVSICRGFLHLLQKGEGGTVINISGGGATSPRQNFLPYSCSKTALLRFSESVAEEFSKKSININSISPGAMPTKLLKEILEVPTNIVGDQEKLAAEKVFKSKNNMERVAALCLFLCSSDARAITGKTISAHWDNWPAWLDGLPSLLDSDAYTLRRIVGKDRGYEWADK